MGATGNRASRYGVALRGGLGRCIRVVRTNIVIDDGLMEEMLRATGLKTRREALTAEKLLSSLEVVEIRPLVKHLGLRAGI